jgi:hypothetical protein
VKYQGKTPLNNEDNERQECKTDHVKGRAGGVNEEGEYGCTFYTYMNMEY